ncbi:MAG: hypothetical protein ACHQUC_04880 [Chlamydiales bacterium]
MEREFEKEVAEVTLLPAHEKIEAEEYVEDADHVYRKKDEVFKRFKFNASIFWMRLACFFGLLAIFIVLILRFIKLLIAFLSSAFQLFKHRPLNQLTWGSWKEFAGAAMVTVGLAVGVINPRWGMRLISLFFSMTDKNKPPFFNAIFRFCGM